MLRPLRHRKNFSPPSWSSLGGVDNSWIRRREPGSIVSGHVSTASRHATKPSMMACARLISTKRSSAKSRQGRHVNGLIQRVADGAQAWQLFAVAMKRSVVRSRKRSDRMARQYDRQEVRELSSPAFHLTTTSPFTFFRNFVCHLLCLRMPTCFAATLLAAGHMALCPQVLLNGDPPAARASCWPL